MYKDKLDPRARKSRRDWYEKNKEKQKIARSSREKEIRSWYKIFKSNLKCNRCEENDPVCLDFHHSDSSKKDIAISRAVHDGWSIERIKKEISKCEVLCSNCHRKLHAKE